MTDTATDLLTALNPIRTWAKALAAKSFHGPKYRTYSPNGRLAIVEAMFCAAGATKVEGPFTPKPGEYGADAFHVTGRAGQTVKIGISTWGGRLIVDGVNPI